MMNDSDSNAVVDDYGSMTVADLRDACKARALQTKGKKSELVARLREDDSYAREMTAEYGNNAPANADSSNVDRRISELLEEAASSGKHVVMKGILDELRAKNAEEPKYVDVKITSLGITPEKFTTGGAPSATADVLRKLAGDPFADPPKYGKVRQ